MRSAVCLVIAVVAFALGGLGSAQAASPVWKVTRPEGGTLYLGGSIHALRRADYPLPKQFDAALAASSRVVFEEDSDKKAMERIMKSGEYPSGDSLKNHVDPRTYAYLTRIFGLMGVPEAKFAKVSAVAAHADALVAEYAGPIHRSRRRGLSHKARARREEADRRVSHDRAADERLYRA
jgi:uncharacterized protein YbaP (TraB family)